MPGPGSTALSISAASISSTRPRSTTLLCRSQTSLVWESDLDTLNLIHCNYMLALGHYGLGNTERAERFLNEVEHLDPIHQGAKALRSLMQLSLI